MTGRIIIEFEKILLEEKPDLVLVYGDTNTTVAGALASAKLKIPIAHVEAGIRQQPKDMPEEINRVITDHISHFLFCPSQLAVRNLKKEGITKNVYFVGDVMYDLYLKMKERFQYEVFEKLNLKENEYILVTLHRDFNVDNSEKLEKILKQLQKISKQIELVFPIHPRTRKRIYEFRFQRFLSGIKVIEPVDYLNFMGLVEKCQKVITDSGGLQKEAYFSGKRTIVIMPDTGWKELVESGWNKLADENNLFRIVMDDEKVDYPKNLYGDGTASDKIIKVIKEFLESR